MKTLGSNHFSRIIACGFALLSACTTVSADDAEPASPGYTLPMLDLNEAEGVHVTVARDIDHDNQYLGHPTTVLLDDDQTLIAVFPTAHGKGQLRMCTSADGGETWAMMPNLGIELHEVPTIFKVERPDGHTRLVITTCTPRTARSAGSTPMMRGRPGPTSKPSTSICPTASSSR